MSDLSDPELTVEVACAVLVDRDDNLLAVQRPPEKALGGFWEFPGGKVEAGEGYEAALRRELREELMIEVGELTALGVAEFCYPFGNVRLYPFLARFEERPEFVMTEHVDFRWGKLPEIKSLDWAPADLPILEELAQIL